MSGFDVDEFNRRQALKAFPPDARWKSIEGVLSQPRSEPGRPPLLSIQGRDPSGAERRIWTDLPNAMYLLRLLQELQRRTGAELPSSPPDPCEPFDGQI